MLSVMYAIPAALKIKEIERVSAQDSECQAVRNCLIEGYWDNAPKSYLPVRNELTFIGHVILRGTRIAIPQALCKRVVSLALERHQGVVKTKERLRTKVWWLVMDCDAERRCEECYGCQVVTKNVPPPPVKPTPLPWEVDVIRTTSSQTIIYCPMPNLQDMGCLKVSVPTTAPISCPTK